MYGFPEGREGGELVLAPTAEDTGLAGAGRVDMLGLDNKDDLIGFAAGGGVDMGDGSLVGHWWRPDRKSWEYIGPR